MCVALGKLPVENIHPRDVVLAFGRVPSYVRDSRPFKFSRHIGLCPFFMRRVICAFMRARTFVCVSYMCTRVPRVPKLCLPSYLPFNLVNARQTSEKKKESLFLTISIVFRKIHATYLVRVPYLIARVSFFS